MSFLSSGAPQHLWQLAYNPMAFKLLQQPNPPSHSHSFGNCLLLQDSERHDSLCHVSVPQRWTWLSRLPTSYKGQPQRAVKPFSWAPVLPRRMWSLYLLKDSPLANYFLSCTQPHFSLLFFFFLTPQTLCCFKVTLLGHEQSRHCHLALSSIGCWFLQKRPRRCPLVSDFHVRYTEGSRSF